MIFIKIILIFVLITILVQDVKFREVYAFLFPVAGLCFGILLKKNLTLNLFYCNTIINLAMVIALIFIVYLYSRYKLKTPITNTFGLGDAFMFLALAFSFATISFFILFVFGLIFSLVLHIITKHKIKQNTVPLAGYLALFFALVYMAHWFGVLKYVYAI